MGFTNYIQQIKDSGGTTHDLVDSSASHYVKGTQTASTNAWTGTLPDGVTAYYDGLTVDYFLPYAGTPSAATLNLSSKGAKPVYLGNKNSAVTTHFPQYAVIHMTYIINSSLNSGDGCWKASAYYDSNTNNAVAQTATTTNANYEVLFSVTADNTTRTEGARKNSNLLFNPSTGNLQATQLNGVTIGSSPKFTDNNTTYTFANGTNGFTVTPSGGSAQTVTVTPSITNNVTGSGTSGYIAKFNGANTITNGPAFGSATTTYLRNDGSWATPANNAVTQTATTSNSSYRVLLSGTADDTTRTEGAYKSTGLQFNASTRNLYVSSGTTNGNLYLGLATTDSLYTAINALGWVSAVIE